MKPRRDIWVAFALLIVLVLVTIAAGIQENRQAEKPAYSSLSPQANGALALRDWLTGMGYQTLPDGLVVFAPPAEARLIFVLEPFDVIEDEISLLDEWVQRGNTLVISGVGPGARLFAHYYQFSMQISATPMPRMFFQNPLLASSMANKAVNLNTEYVLVASRNEYVAHLGHGDQPVLVSFRQGRGQVILSSAPYMFSNRGLKETGMPELTLNTLRLAENNGPVWFDEWHHGLRGINTEVSGPTQWLARTPIGHALLFVAGVIFLGLLLQGRLFGRPVPPTHEIRRRAPLEYIRAIANLGRRAGHRRDVMAQYYAALKRGLGKRYRLDPTLPNQEYVALLGKYNPTIDQAVLLELLANLQKDHPGEAEMVKLASETAEWLKNK